MANALRYLSLERMEASVATYLPAQAKMFLHLLAADFGEERPRLGASFWPRVLRWAASKTEWGPNMNPEFEFASKCYLPWIEIEKIRLRGIYYARFEFGLPIQVSFGQISLPSFFSSSSDLWNPFIGVGTAMGSLSCCRPLFESGVDPVDGFGSQRGPHHKTTVNRTVTPSTHHTNCTKTVGRVFFP